MLGTGMIGWGDRNNEKIERVFGLKYRGLKRSERSVLASKK